MLGGDHLRAVTHQQRAQRQTARFRDAARRIDLNAVIGAVLGPVDVKCLAIPIRGSKDSQIDSGNSPRSCSNDLPVKRLFDFSLAALAVVLLLVPACLVAALVKLTSPGPILYWSDRVGRHNGIFRMPKFRSMRVGTPAVATHLLTDPDAFLTPIGSFLRRSSLDELPQLWSILVGDMSFVGPRPALYNQHDLVAERTAHGIDQLTPGLTGWAQVNGRDELPIPEKVKFDREYMQRQSLLLDIRILWLTFVKVLRHEGVTH